MIRVESRHGVDSFQVLALPECIFRLAKELKPQPLLEMHFLVSYIAVSAGDTCVCTDVQHPLGRRRQRQVETSFVITIYLVLHCFAGCWPFNRANGKVPECAPALCQEHFVKRLQSSSTSLEAHELRSASFPRQLSSYQCAITIISWHNLVTRTSNCF